MIGSHELIYTTHPYVGVWNDAAYDVFHSLMWSDDADFPLFQNRATLQMFDVATTEDPGVFEDESLPTSLDLADFPSLASIGG